MFKAKEFLEKVNAGKIKEALGMLVQPDEKKCNPEVIQAIRAVDPKTNETLLHHLAQSTILNEVLEEKSSQQDDAKLLLRLVLQHSAPSTRKRSNKRTALVEASYWNHRAIVDEIYQPHYLNIQDSDGNTVLHHAINHANHVLINRIIEDDRLSYSLYFKANKAGLFSLALAMKRYQENPSSLALSLINQLYFSLPRGQYRTMAVEKDISVDWSMFYQPLWQNALRMCGKRDERNLVKSIDLNLWDLVVQVIKDGLTVWGVDVTLPIIYKYSYSKSDTPGDMLKDANAKREIGLPGRTLAQTATNATLAKNKEFMQRVNLGQANYHLFHTNNDPAAESKELKRLANNKDWIILFGEKLFYLPQRLESKPAVCKEIVRDERKEKDQASFDTLKNSIAKITKGEFYPAKSADIQNIMPLVPLMLDQQSDAVPLVPLRSKDHRVVGMTFYAGLSSRVDVTAPVATDTTTIKNRM